MNGWGVDKGTAIILLTVSLAGAATRWVSPAGTDASGRGSQSAPFKTLSYACNQTSAGDTVRLTAGEFRETNQTVLKSGVTIAGNGRDGSDRTVVHAPLSWDFSADEWTDNDAGYVIRISNAANCAVGGIELRGNDWKANGAFLITDARNVSIHDCSIYNFRMYGVKISGADRLTMHDASIENSGFEQGKKAGSAFPDGGSLGGIGLHSSKKCTFRNMTIKTTGLHGYGMKIGAIDSCVFSNMTFDMYPYQSWNSPIGQPGGGNFDFENHGGHITMTEFHHCTFGATLSIMGGSGNLYDNVDYSCHIHHCFFDLKGQYGIELGTDKIVVDHNYFKNTWAVMQNFGGSEIRINGLVFCHNVCDDIGMRVIGSAGKLSNLRFFNNTVCMKNDGWQSYIVTMEHQNGSSRWSFVNNILSGDPQAPDANQVILSIGGATHVADVYGANNISYRERMVVQGASGPVDTASWDYTFVNNIDMNPSLPLSGPAPTQAFYPPSGSPAIDRGDASWGMPTTFNGQGRDIGAYENGLPAWSAGNGTADTCLYLWAPRSSVTSEYFVNQVHVDLSTPAEGAQIRYTLDGTEPSTRSQLYSSPVVITKPTRFRARVFKDGWGGIAVYARDFQTGVKGYPEVGSRGVCSASSSYDPFTYGCEKAFDGETYSWVGWCPAVNDALPWLKVDLGKACVVKYVQVYTRAQVGADAAGSRRNFAIQGSDNPAFGTFTVLASQGPTALPFEGVFSAEVTVPDKFRYVRAIKTVANEGLFIAELKLHADTGGTPVVFDQPRPRPARERITFRSVNGGMLELRAGADVVILSAELFDLRGRRTTLRTPTAPRSPTVRQASGRGVLVARFRLKEGLLTTRVPGL